MVLHSHDEIVSVIPKDDSEEAMDRAVQIMCTGPDWAEGLPLDAEGGLSDVYRK